MGPLSGRYCNMCGDGLAYDSFTPSCRQCINWMQPTPRTVVIGNITDGGKHVGTVVGSDQMSATRKAATFVSDYLSKWMQTAPLNACKCQSWNGAAHSHHAVPIMSVSYSEQEV